MPTKKRGSEVSKKTLKQVLSQINKQYDGAVSCFDGAEMNVNRLHSGSLLLDAALDGGYPQGRNVEVFGDEGSGKTTTALHACKAALDKYPEKNIAYVDTEHALSIQLARNMGIDFQGDDRCILIQPDSAEDAFAIIEELMNNVELSVIVLDSVSALMTRKQLEAGYDEHTMAEVARFLSSKVFPKLTPRLKKSDTLFILINQLRQKIGVTFGSNKTTMGGKALRFYASIRVELTVIKREKEQGFNNVRANVVKNKVGMPYRQTEFKLVYGKGIDTRDELAKLAIQEEIIYKKGNTYYLCQKKQDKKLAVGYPALVEAIGNSEKIIEYLRKALKL